MELRAQTSRDLGMDSPPGGGRFLRLYRSGGQRCPTKAADASAECLLKRITVLGAAREENLCRLPRNPCRSLAANPPGGETTEPETEAEDPEGRSKEARDSETREHREAGWVALGSQAATHQEDRVRSVEKRQNAGHAGLLRLRQNDWQHAGLHGLAVQHVLHPAEILARLWAGKAGRAKQGSNRVLQRH